MKTKTFLTIIVILVAIALAAQYFYNKTTTLLTDEQAADIALRAVIADGRQDWLKYNCAEVYFKERKAHAIKFGLYELHNSTCGGDPNTAPHITDVVVDLENGEAYDQPVIIDSIDQGWKTKVIGGWEQDVTKQISEAGATENKKEVKIFLD